MVICETQISNIKNALYQCSAQKQIIIEGMLIQE